MTFSNHEIKTNINVGKHIFESLPNDIKPVWASLILSYFDQYIRYVPIPIVELYPMVADKDAWGKAHEQFSRIRSFSFDNEEFQPKFYLILAEKVAKVTYNASGKSAPFDSDSGYYIPSLALNIAEYFDASGRFEDEIKAKVLLFNHNRKIKSQLAIAHDFLLYNKIDDILWADWDPIGINGDGSRDEYQNYIPAVFRLIKNKADRQEIANRLHKFETEIMGIEGTMDHSLKVADKLLGLL